MKLDLALKLLAWPFPSDDQGATQRADTERFVRHARQLATQDQPFPVLAYIDTGNPGTGGGFARLAHLHEHVEHLVHFALDSGYLQKRAVILIHDSSRPDEVWRG